MQLTRNVARPVRPATPSKTTSVVIILSAVRKFAQLMDYAVGADKDIFIPVTNVFRIGSGMTDAMCWTRLRAV